eukprot:scaffold163063_cov31-Tisochrysis_lutea.AAC.1
MSEILSLQSGGLMLTLSRKDAAEPQAHPRMMRTRKGVPASCIGLLQRSPIPAASRDPSSTRDERERVEVVEAHRAAASAAALPTSSELAGQTRQRSASHTSSHASVRFPSIRRLHGSRGAGGRKEEEGGGRVGRGGREEGGRPPPPPSPPPSR